MNSDMQQMVAWYRAEIERLQSRSNDLAFTNAMQRTAIVEEVARYVSCHERDGLVQSQPLLRHLSEMSNGLLLTAHRPAATQPPQRAKRDREARTDPPPPPVVASSSPPHSSLVGKRCRDSQVDVDPENEFSHESQHFHMAQPVPRY